MAKKFTVFLSSTGADLADYRKAVMARLAKSDHIDCDGMENFGARPGPPDAFCRERAQACDVYVGLIGFYRGNDVPGDNAQRSFTEMEYAVATAAGKSRLMYIVPDDFAPPAPAQTKTAAKLQAAFRKSVLKNHVVSKEFHSPDRLAGAIVVDLMNLLAEKIAADLAPQGGALPGQHQAVVEALAAVMEAADEGDSRMARAFDLLKENNIAEAEPLLRAVAEQKAAKIDQDRMLIAAESKVAATAFRHLGAIAGFSDPRRAAEAYTKACELDPDDLSSKFWLGWLELARGRHAEALNWLGNASKLADDQKLPWYQYWISVGEGDIFFAKEKWTEAKLAYEKARGIAKKASRSNDGDWKRELAISSSKMGDVKSELNLLPSALKEYRASLRSFESLTVSDSEYDNWCRDKSIAYDRMGDVLIQLERPAKALESFKKALEISSLLAEKNPNNAMLQRDLSISFNNIGNALVACGETVDALKYFHKDHEIADRLAKTDPSNAQWQFDLLLSHVKLAKFGDVPEQRWDLIVEILQKLKADDKLPAEVLHRLSATGAILDD